MIFLRRLSGGAKALTDASTIRHLLTNRRLPPDKAVVLFSRAGLLPDAYATFRSSPDVRTLNAFLFGLVMANKHSQVEPMFRVLTRRFGIRPDLRTFNTVVKGMCGDGRAMEGFAVLEEMRRNRVKPNRVTFNEMIAGFFRVGRKREGGGLVEDKGFGVVRRKGGIFDGLLIKEEGLDELECRGGKSNMVTEDGGGIGGSLKGRRIDGVLVEEVGLDELGQRGGTSNVVCGGDEIGGPDKGGSFDGLLIKEEHSDELEKQGVKANVVTGNTGFGGSSKGGSFEGVLMKEGNDVTGGLLKDWSFGGVKDENLDVLEKKRGKSNVVPGDVVIGRSRRGVMFDGVLMEEKSGDFGQRGVKSNASRDNAMIPGSCKEGSFEGDTMKDGNSGFFGAAVEMRQKGVKPNKLVISGLCKGGSLEGVWRVLRMMKEYNYGVGVSTWNVIIQGLCKLGRSEEGKKVLEDMRSRGMTPNSVSYGHLIHGFCREGNLAEAKRVFLEMGEDDRVADSECYFTLVYYLCKGGEFEEGLRICRESMDRNWVPKFTTMKALVEGLVGISKVEEAKEVVVEVKRRFPHNAGVWKQLEDTLYSR